MDPRPSALEAAAETLAQVRPTAAGRARIAAGVMHRVERGNRLRVVYWAGAVLVAAAVLAWMWRPDPAPPVASGFVVAESSVSLRERGLGVGEVVDAANGVTLVAGEHIEAHDEAVTVAIEGPAQARFGPGEVVVDRGHARVDGRTTVVGCGCTAEIDGTVEVEATGAVLQLTVVAGAVHRAESPTCQVERVEKAEVERAEPAPPEEDRSSESGAVGPEAGNRRRARKTQPESASALSQQVTAYQAARELSSRNPKAALQKWRAFRRRWPRSALRQEADAHVIDTLKALGRHDEARRAAKSFVRRYPRSAHARRLKELAREPAQP